MCFPEGELLLGPGDLRLGDAGGCPLYVDDEQYERWRRPSFVLDVGPGGGSGMSLEELHGVHFVLRPAPAATAAQ
jgi:uncharacterized protein (DUF779 family)